MNCPTVPVSNPNDPTYNADCAVLSQVAIAGLSSTPTDPPTASGELSNAGPSLSTLCPICESARNCRLGRYVLAQVRKSLSAYALCKQ